MKNPIMKFGLLLAVILATMAMTAFAYADEDEWYATPTIGGQNVLLQDSDGDLSVNPDLPKGVSYNKATNTLTLSNCTIKAGSGTDAYIESWYSDLNLVLKGTNKFTGLRGSQPQGLAFFGIVTQQNELHISGSGSLTMDFSETTGPVFGIWGNRSISISGSTLNITGTGSTPRDGFFYGISMDAGYNYADEEAYDEEEEESSEPSDEEFAVTIQNAKVNISNESAGEGINIGIDSQDSDLKIENSTVQLDMTGGGAWGIGCGWVSGDTAYGGKLSIDAASNVTIRLQKPSDYYVDQGDVFAAYCFDTSGIASKYIYTGNPGTAAKLTGKSAFLASDYYDGRLEVKDQFLEFASSERTHENPVLPGGSDVTEPTDPSDPSDPTDPTNPTDPTEPSDPTEPTDPTDPTGPTDPTDPSDPVEPTDPTKPTNPTDPTDPTEPYVPEITIGNGIIGSVTASPRTFTYNGKLQMPKIIVKDTDGTVIPASQYSLSYGIKGKEIGIYEIRLSFRDQYLWSADEVATYTILPAKSKVTKAKAGKKKVKLTAKKVGGKYIQYQFAVRKAGTSKWKYYTSGKNTLTVKKLKSKKKYQIMVRAFAESRGENNQYWEKKVYGTWSKIKTVKVK